MLRQVTVLAARSASRLALKTPAPASACGAVRCYYKYTASHEYVKVDKATGKIGITGFAAQALGDVVYVDLPRVGDSFKKEESFGAVESVKASSDVYMPVSGEVLEVNEQLKENPGLVNESAEDKGWFIKIKITNPEELKDSSLFDTPREE